MKNILSLLVSALIGLSCVAPQSGDIKYSKLDSKAFVKAYKKTIDNNILIDVRTPGEFKRGSIENALNINYYDDNFIEQISKLDTTKTAFIFCQSGGRSGKSSKAFFKAGFKEVIDLKGGYSHLKK